MTTLLPLAATAASCCDHWNRPGWWPVFPLLWFLFLAGALTAFVLTRRRREQESGRRVGERVLAERFAAGELDDAEYQRRLGVLRTAGRR